MLSHVDALTRGELCSNGTAVGIVLVLLSEPLIRFPWIGWVSISRIHGKIWRLETRCHLHSRALKTMRPGWITLTT